MSAAHASQSTVPASPVLYLAFELGWKSWKLAFTVGGGQRPRLRTMAGRDMAGLIREIQSAKSRFGLAEETPVLSCYEAGRDGFWLHRFLVHLGIRNLVVDSSSIEVNRRARRAKSDCLDAVKLVEMLILRRRREGSGQRSEFQPSNEDGRQLHRERMILVKNGRAYEPDQGLHWLVRLRRDACQASEQLGSCGSGAVRFPCAPGAILREFSGGGGGSQGRQRTQAMRNEKTPDVELVRQLMLLRGIGANGAWILVREVFGWREITNRRELASLMGLAPSPYSSGDTRHEQGISKAGNRRVRWLMVELAWCWLRYQPESDLSVWYRERFGGGSLRQRRIGIVALARKLLVALWKYLKGGEVPEGAELKDSAEESTGDDEPRRKAS